MSNEISPRKELGKFVGNGILRSVLEMHPNGLSQEALELLIRIASTYCEPRRVKRKIIKHT